jgi:ADP-heptose:LPS heptosyltransferase
VPVRRYRYSKWRWRVLVHALDAVGSLAMRLWRLVRPAPAPAPPRRILLVQLDHLGDSVLTSPMFPRLRAAYPEAIIDVLASPSNRAVFESDPHVDRVWLADRNWFERRPGHRALASAVWGLARSLRGAGYDLGIDVRGDVLTVLMLALAGIPRRVGWAMGGGGFLLTDVAPWVPGRHEVASRLALLEPLGIPAEGPARVSVHASDRDRARVGRWLKEAWPTRGPLARSRVPIRVPSISRSPSPVALAPEAVGFGEGPADAESLHAGRFGSRAPLLAVHLGAGTAAKRWPISSWDALVSRFLADGWRVIVVGGPGDEPSAEALSPHDDLSDWTGRLAVTETTALLERADLFIGADSGPAHLAACAGVTSVVLFSGTNRSRQWRPWSRRCLVLKRRVPCRPCHAKVCPLADHPCMTGLHPDRVYRAARRWWARLHHAESPHAPL